MHSKKPKAAQLAVRPHIKDIPHPAPKKLWKQHCVGENIDPTTGQELFNQHIDKLKRWKEKEPFHKCLKHYFPFNQLAKADWDCLVGNLWRKRIFWFHYLKPDFFDGNLDSPSLHYSTVQNPSRCNVYVEKVANLLEDKKFFREYKRARIFNEHEIPKLEKEVDFHCFVNFWEELSKKKFKKFLQNQQWLIGSASKVISRN